MILLDTHALIWALMAPVLLSPAARAAIEGARLRAISSVSLYEIRYKHALGKWPEVGALCADGIAPRLQGVGVDVLPADAAVMELAGAADWTHRDPFDRIIAATASIRRIPLVSCDAMIDAAPMDSFTRIW